MNLANWRWKEKDHSPWISEFYTDNYWFHTVDLYRQELNQPVRGDIKADSRLAMEYFNLTAERNLKRNHS